MKRFHVLAAALALAVAAHAAPPAGPELAKEVLGESRFTLTETSRVSFGAGSTFVERTLVPGTHLCDYPAFGLTTGGGVVRRACSLTLAPGAALPTYSQVAIEGKTFTLSAESEVRFGINGRWTSITLPAGTHPCSLPTFRNVDPWVGVLKSCERINTAMTTPTTPTTPPPVVVVPPVVTPTPTDPVTPVVAGEVDTPEKYRALIKTLGTDAWFLATKGSPSTFRSTNTAPGPRPTQSMMALSGQQNPLVRFADGKLGGRGCGADRVWNWCGTFQIGTPGTTIPDQGVPGQTVTGLLGEPGDYSSSIFNIAYTPDVPVPIGFPEPRYFGMASLQTLSIGHGSVSLKPEPSWTTHGGTNNNGGDNDENHRRFAGLHPDGSPVGTFPLGKVVDAFRGYGRGGWTNNTATLWDDGRITTSGSNTSHNLATLKLSSDCKPTAGAISNSGEIMLVTCWDPDAYAGKLAVIALADGCQWCDAVNAPNESWGENWGSARRAYPGMPGLGNYVGLKFLGYVPLPANLKAPTGVSVTTGHQNSGYDGYQRIQSFWKAPLDTAAGRAFYYSGDAASGSMARTGMAVVTSKFESTVAYVDLGPLFRFIREQYVGPQTDAQFAAKIASRGPADNQFPLGFDSAPQQRPTVIKVDQLASRPTVSRMMTEAPFRAFVATEDGKLRIVDLGTRYLNQAGTGGGAPADIKELSSINIGANPTSLAHVEEKARYLNNGISALWRDDTHEKFFLWGLSRADQKATLLRLNSDATQFSVFRTLQDSRFKDAVFLADGANHGTESYLLSLLDYAGRAAYTFSYGPLIMHTYPQEGAAWPAPCTKARPCLPLDGAQFSFEGVHKLPGKPFAGGLSNIN